MLNMKAKLTIRIRSLKKFCSSLSIGSDPGIVWIRITGSKIWNNRIFSLNIYWPANKIIMKFFNLLNKFIVKYWNKADFSGRIRTLLFLEGPIRIKSILIRIHNYAWRCVHSISLIKGVSRGGVIGVILNKKYQRVNILKCKNLIIPCWIFSASIRVT